MEQAAGRGNHSFEQYVDIRDWSLMQRAFEEQVDETIFRWADYPASSASGTRLGIMRPETISWLPEDDCLAA